MLEDQRTSLEHGSVDLFQQARRRGRGTERLPAFRVGLESLDETHHLVGELGLDEPTGARLLETPATKERKRHRVSTCEGRSSASLAPAAGAFVRSVAISVTTSDDSACAGSPRCRAPGGLLLSPGPTPVGWVEGVRSLPGAMRAVRKARRGIALSRLRRGALAPT